MRQLTINDTSWLEFKDVLEAREPFKTYGNLSGNNSYDPYYGMLHEPFKSEYVGRSGYIDYVVFSYSTPIAWHDSELGWIMPDTKYSMTTSKAQGRIAPAIAALQRGE